MFISCFSFSISVFRKFFRGRRVFSFGFIYFTLDLFWRVVFVSRVCKDFSFFFVCIRRCRSRFSARREFSRVVGI